MLLFDDATSFVKQLLKVTIHILSVLVFVLEEFFSSFLKLDFSLLSFEHFFMLPFHQHHKLVLFDHQWVLKF